MTTETSTIIRNFKFFLIEIMKKSIWENESKGRVVTPAELASMNTKEKEL
jgi:hypothetical protein